MFFLSALTLLRKPLTFPDADYATEKLGRKSIYGAVVSCSSKKQQSVAGSTTEAEFLALSRAVKHAIWINNLAAVLQGQDGSSAKNIPLIYGDKGFNSAYQGRV